MRTIEDNLAQVLEAQIFTKLDALTGSSQLKFDELSTNIRAVLTEL